MTGSDTNKRGSVERGPADAGHRPVMQTEVLRALAIKDDGWYLDGTYGRGGHSGAILSCLGDGGRLLALDRDPEAVMDARRRFGDERRFEIERCGFAMLGKAIEQRGWQGRLSGVLLDLGVSSPQLDDAERGFSFLRDGPLDMRMDPDDGPSAADWLACADRQAIITVLREYGEERHARRIADAILERRAGAPLTRTGELAALVAAAIPHPEPGKNPATRTFQAIRIKVNRELDQLRAALPQCLAALAPGGRLAVISFHSLEDRITKRFLRDQSRPPVLPREIPVTAEQSRSALRLVGKAIRAGGDEIARNPRARSAVLRVAERLT